MVPSFIMKGTIYLLLLVTVHICIYIPKQKISCSMVEITLSLLRKADIVLPVITVQIKIYKFSDV